MSTIFVIDSDQFFNTTLTRELQANGHQVQSFSLGKEALKAARSAQPDSMVISVELEDVNGFSLCNKIKKDKVLKSTHIVMVSRDANASDFENHKGFKTAAQAYFNKPVSNAIVLQALSLGGEKEDQRESARSNEGNADLIESTQIMTPGVAPQTSASMEAQVTFGDLDLADLSALEIDENQLINSSQSESNEDSVPQESKAPSNATRDPDASISLPLSRQVAHNSNERTSFDQRVSLRKENSELKEQLGKIQTELSLMQREVDRLRQDSGASNDNGASELHEREMITIKKALQDQERENLKLKDELVVRDESLLNLRTEKKALDEEVRTFVPLKERLEVELEQLQKRKDDLEAEKLNLDQEYQSYYQKSEVRIQDLEQIVASMKVDALKQSQATRDFTQKIKDGLVLLEESRVQKDRALKEIELGLEQAKGFEEA